MGRNSRNSKRLAEKNIEKTKKRKNFEKNDGNLTLRRSTRITSNTFATNKITNKRLTLPIGFFSSGIKSAVAKKSGEKDIYNEHSKLILNEDLHALLQNFDQESGKDIARSTRNTASFRGKLPKKTHNNSSENNFSTVSSYYLQVSTKNQAENDKRSSRNSNFDLTYNNNGFFEENNLAATSEGNLDKEFQLGQSQYAPSSSQKLALDVTDIRFRTKNFRFAASLHAQLKFNYRSHKNEFIVRVKLNAQHVNDILDGKSEPEIEEQEDEMLSKRYPCKEVQNLQDDVPLVPQSQWVYSTPNKQNIKKFVFEDANSDKIVPAVIETTKKKKVLYDINTEIVKNVNLAKFKGESIPIDERYLNTICKTTIEEGGAKKRQKISDVKENVFKFSEATKFQFSMSTSTDFNFEPSNNVFASNLPEESIDIRHLIDLPMDEDAVDCVFEEDPYERAPVDYRHQLLMATQRPSKTTKKTSKRHLLKAKSLSFENTPPRSTSSSHFIEPKRLELSTRDIFERDFMQLPENNVADTVFSVPSQPAFFPRRNFDKE